MEVLVVVLCFFGSWIGFAVWAHRHKKLSWTISAGGGFIVGCLSFIVAATMFIPSKEDAKAATPALTPEQQRAADRKKMIEQSFSAWDGSHRGLESLIKKSMNDPDSYQHVETVYWDRGDFLVVRTTFRGKNAFGALMKNWVKAKVSLSGEVIEVIEEGS